MAKVLFVHDWTGFWSNIRWPEPLHLWRAITFRVGYPHVDRHQRSIVTSHPMPPDNFFTRIINQGVAINQYVTYLCVLVQFGIHHSRTQSNCTLNPIPYSLNVIPSNLMPFANNTNPATVFFPITQNQIIADLTIIPMPQSQRPLAANDGVFFVYIAT